MRTCDARGCDEPAAVGVRTTHGARDAVGLKTVVYTDVADAPKGATGYCAPHAAGLLHDLIMTMAQPPVGAPT